MLNLFPYFYFNNTKNKPRFQSENVSHSLVVIKTYSCYLDVLYHFQIEFQRIRYILPVLLQHVRFQKSVISNSVCSTTFLHRHATISSVKHESWIQLFNYSTFLFSPSPSPTGVLCSLFSPSPSLEWIVGISYLRQLDCEFDSHIFWVNIVLWQLTKVHCTFANAPSGILTTD
jgi:hypothetical protein